MNQTDKKTLALAQFTLKKNNQVTSSAKLRVEGERVRNCYFGENTEGTLSEESTHNLRLDDEQETSM